MKKPSKQAVPRITRGVIPTAIASGLLSPVTMGAPGDLDPAFGDMGRVASALRFDGPAWSVQPLSGDESLFAGGEYSYYSFYYAEYDSGYAGELSGSGALDSQFSAVALNDMEVRGVALQADGKVIAVGRKFAGSSNVFTVQRLMPDGTIDSTFANKGMLQQIAADGAQAVTLDPSGAIVVAGSSAGHLLVMRLLTDGTPDPSFGVAGIFNGPPNQFIATSILPATGGGYRISTNYTDSTGITTQCRVIGVTADGKIDNTFGTAGVATPVTTPGIGFGCASMVAQPDGRLLIAGQQNSQAFAVRLLANGTADGSFMASAVPAAMLSATALAVDAAGNVMVAGTPPSGVAGALVVRLQATGTLDPVFGNAGTAWIDLDSSAAPVVHDMKVLADGGVMAAGGGPGPFVVRLLGEAGSAGAGVIGFASSFVGLKGQEQSASLTVRRTGGAAGAVSVAYHTGAAAQDAPTAVPGHDYKAVTGQLNWADGDRTDRLITVPIIPPTGAVELSEDFVVTLDSATGGVALGTSNGEVQILGGGGPVGQFDLQVASQTVANTAGTVSVTVDRNYYASGATAVTLTAVPGAGAAADSVPGPVTLSWSDGDTAPKTATFAITASGSQATQSFSVQLSNATNGAVIGPLSVETITVTGSSPIIPPPPRSGGGGGGALDWLMLAGLGMIRGLRRRLG